MRRTPCNDGWKVRRKANRFLEHGGGARRVGAGHAPPRRDDRHRAVAVGRRRQRATSPAASGSTSGRSTSPPRTRARRSPSRFEGVYRDVVVHVNGEFAGHRPYGYSELVVPIDHLLRYGDENTIGSRPGPTRTPAGTPAPASTGTCGCSAAGRVHLAPDELVVRTPEVDDEVAVVTVGDGGPQPVDDPLGGRAPHRAARRRRRGSSPTEESPVTTFPGDELTTFQRLFVAEPQRWGVDHPTSTRAGSRCSPATRCSTRTRPRFGIRTLSLDPRRGLRINGEPVDLRGACIHHDNGPIGAATIDRAEERRVELLKAAGFNAIRSAHNPMSRAMLDACDRLGMLVMDETFDMWTAAEDRRRLLAAVRRLVGGRRRGDGGKDRNHPSVVFYSIGNEIPDASTDVGVHRGRAMAEAIRALDATRFVTQAVNGLLVRARCHRRRAGSRRRGAGRRRQRRQHRDDQDVRRPVAGDDAHRRSPRRPRR